MLITKWKTGKGNCIIFTLQPREQKEKESRRLRSQTRQVLVTPFPGLGWGLSFKNTILALLIMYVWTPVISMYFCISATLITSWYDDLLIYKIQYNFINPSNITVAVPRDVNMNDVSCIMYNHHMTRVIWDI